MITFSLPIEWAINMRISQESNRSRNGSNWDTPLYIIYIVPTRRKNWVVHHYVASDMILIDSIIHISLRKKPDGLTYPDKCDCDVYHWYWCTLSSSKGAVTRAWLVGNAWQFALWHFEYFHRVFTTVVVKILNIFRFSQSIY